DAWVLGDGLERLVEFAESRPDAAVVGPGLGEPAGALPRPLGGEPTLWRGGAREPRRRHQRPPPPRADPCLCPGPCPPAGARGGVAAGGRAARPAIGDRGGRAVRRGVLHVQRGNRLVASVPGGGVEGAVLPGRRGRARRRRLARRAAQRREPARDPALPREAPR